MFVVIEGPSGVGKSTFCATLERYLRSEGVTVGATKEPTSSPIGVFVREGEQLYDGRTLALLVAADRSHHAQEVIASSDKQVVLCDRYLLSSLVLQGLDGVSDEFVHQINAGIPVPDLTILLDAPEEVLEHRLQQRPRLTRLEHYSKAERERFLQGAAALEAIGWSIWRVNTGEFEASILAEQVGRRLTEEYTLY